MLTPTADPLAQDLRVGGDHILETLQEHAVEEQWSLAGRTLLAVHLLRRPSVSAPKAQRDAFKALGDAVQAWLKDEIAKSLCVWTSSKTQPSARTYCPDVERIQALLTPYAADAMIAYPVSPRVNNPAYDAPECIAPLA